MARPSITRFGVEEISQLKLRCSKFTDQIVPLSDLVLKQDASKKTKSASVLIPLCNFKGVPSVIFTLRSATVGTHKGQVSFPGGHMNEDESAVDAAIRESIEELGSGIGEIEIVGQCQTIPAVTGTMVTPIIGFLKHSYDDFSCFTPNACEVDRVFIRSLDQLLDPDYKTIETYERNGKVMSLPVFGAHEKEEKIWGLTAFILQGVLDHVILPPENSKV